MLIASPRMEPHPLAHIVFFTLKDRSDAAIDSFIAACRASLTGHPGTIHFSAGPRAQLRAPVNDQQFDVAVVLIFETQAAHDAYQSSPRHKQFLADQSPHWTQVRVFDAFG